MNRPTWMKAYKIANKDRSNNQARVRYWKNPDFFRNKNREGYKKQKLQGFDFKAKALKHKWGLTKEDYETKLKTQEGACAICGTREPKGRGRFHIDHDHVTNRIRGLLCHCCNLMLGHAKDDTNTLLKALDYLYRYAFTIG